METQMSYFQKHPNVTKSSFNTFMSKGQFKDVSIHASIFEARVTGSPNVELEVYSAPEQERMTFEHAVKQEFKPIENGHSFGPSWTTHWVRATLQIPSEFAGKEVRLLFNPSCESMVWSADGQPLQGLTGGDGNDRRHEFILTSKAGAKEAKRILYLEVACNGMFGVGDYIIGPPDPNRYFTLQPVELIVKRPKACALYHDLVVLSQIIDELSKDSPRWWQGLSTVDKVMTAYDATDENSLDACLAITSEFFKAKTGDAAHQVYAIGNCHIDTAWLWPYDETKRKIARSWSTQLGLIEKYPDYMFAASQAQQFEWLKEFYPGLFARVKEQIKEGRFIPIGGTWIEMDCNIPSGESFVRQFLLGQKFFEENFGERCKVFWLPDTFGYSSQLPQIMKLSGAEYFFTQKLSWNNINKFPHTTFRWVGLDGSDVLCHMCPAETYTAEAKANQLISSVKKHKDIGYTNESLYLYGFGDGGGGPSEEMLERLSRMKNVDALPKVKHAHPNEFYDYVSKNSKDLVTWNGELYFELHRGTYTSQAKTKKQNRQSEYLLRDVEMLSAIARSLGKDLVYPAAEITRLWKLVCLNQFHDVIPGSSIEMVYEDSDKIYADVLESARDMKENAIVALFGDSGMCATEQATGTLVFNSTSWPRTDVVAVPGMSQGLGAQQVRKQDQATLMVAASVPSGGVQIVSPVNDANVVPVSAYCDSNGHFVLENLYVTAKFNASGHLASFVDRRMERELIPKGRAGNVMRLHDDVPIFWDAWDIEINHLHKFSVMDASSITIIDEGPLLASIAIEIPVGKSSKMKQYVSLSAVSLRLDFDCDVDWHESHKCLKTAFTWDIRSKFATYETQYGVVQRPTHRNTTWDMAKFEVCAHKFGDLSEFGYGVALLNDSKYGYATLDSTMTITLLRSPKSPDANCDMGHQSFRYAVYPHQGSFNESRVVQEAYQFNVPLVQLPVDMQVAAASELQGSSFFAVSDAPNVVLDMVKAAEDGSHDVIVRLYEAYGGHGKAVLTTKLAFGGVAKTNILEEQTESLDLKAAAGSGKDRSMVVNIKPFEVVTLRFKA